MDILAHALWAGIGVAAVARRCAVTRHFAVLAVGLAVAPDIVQLLPVVGWTASQPGGWATLGAYATALPGSEPELPPLVESLAHHLHCLLHSAIVAAAITAAAWRFRRRLWAPLFGWWSHIVIDVFTHSAAFYPSPVLYPITRQGFDGIAWNTPAFMLANYAAIAAAIAALILTRRRAAAKPRAAARPP